MALVDGPLDVVRRALPDLAGARVLDIGCGEGRLAQALAAAGAEVTGVDPNPEAIATARVAAPGAWFDVAGAEALPLPDYSMDVAVIFNALHHVPAPLMRKALEEARRVLRRDGRLVVIEPDVCGSFFEVVKIVDDETAVRNEARVAVDAAIDARLFSLEDRLSFVRRDVVADVDAIARRIVAVDPQRASAVTAKRADLAATFDRVASTSAHGRLLEQPHWAVILAPR